MTDVQVPASAVEPTPLEEVAGQFLAYLHASGCSPNTLRAYGHDLTHLAAFLVEAISEAVDADPDTGAARSGMTAAVSDETDDEGRGVPGMKQSARP
jgi:Phage integrase, N-terminal SAM-like domain